MIETVKTRGLVSIACNYSWVMVGPGVDCNGLIGRFAKHLPIMIFRKEMRDVVSGCCEYRCNGLDPGTGAKGINQ